MKYEVKKEYILNADESEMEMMVKAISIAIGVMAKEVAERGELEHCADPSRVFMKETARKWIDFLLSLCDAIDDKDSSNMYDLTYDTLRMIFEKDER